MERTLIKDLKNHVGNTVSISGWVDVRRDQGKMVFFDFRDRTGKVQGVVLPKSEAMIVAKDVRPEDAVSIEGIVNKRPDKNVQADRENGDIELEIKGITVLNGSKTPPYDIMGDTSGIDEEVRLKYRYLDLRNPRMQRNMHIRHDFIRHIRDFLFKNDFIEMETPLLTESTPEGSRDFVVPSRLHPGQFYALPQSPQQYKQLLMTAGFERYFQIARCLRDEDLRADRGFEHSQVDIEMSFMSRDEVMNLIEAMITEVVETMGYSIKQKPFPRITYADAMRTYGSDKFDMRTPAEKDKGILAYAWVIEFPFFEKTDGGGWTFSHNPFSMPLTPEDTKKLMEKRDIESILTSQYDLVCNGFETGGGSIRAHRPEILRAVYDVMGFSKEEIEERVGHMLEAFEFGTPPHGGIALGIERNIMNLANESYLREVQAFPMTRGGKTAVMRAPKPLEKNQLTELGLDIKKKK